MTDLTPSSTSNPFFIVGFMACGKTTFGRALARRLNRQFIDLDFYIEQRFRKSIREIFAEKGEAEFRRMEREMLREVGEFDNVVVACGGGTPCFSDNMDYMSQRGLTVWLEASEERIVERLMANNSRRPLMAGKNQSELQEAVHAGLAARFPHYSRATVRFSGEQLEDRHQIADTVSTFIDRLNSDFLQ